MASELVLAVRSERGEKGGKGNSFGGHCCDCGCGGDGGGGWHVMRLKWNLVVGWVDCRGSLFFVLR